MNESRDNRGFFVIEFFGYIKQQLTDFFNVIISQSLNSCRMPKQHLSKFYQ